MNANLHAWRSRRFSYGIEESRKNRARELDMYTVVPDTDHALIRVALSGFWDTAVAKRYVGELSTAVACVVDHHGSFNLFVEMTEVLPFSQDVATILGDAIAELRKRGLHKVAHISPSTLAQIQIRRSEEHTSELQSLMRISYTVLSSKHNTTSRTNIPTA